MIITPTELPEVMHVQSTVHGDVRGLFSELCRTDELAAHGVKRVFTQDNFSRSARHVLRGLHYQRRSPQGKYVRVLTGRIFDVAVDLRRSSPNFGRWVGRELDGMRGDALWVPEGFAHGFLVLSESADVYYKCTTPYQPDDEYAVRWNDQTLGIDWPIREMPVVSPRDAAAPPLDPDHCFS